MRHDDETVTLTEVTASKETEQALLCCIDGRDVWVPQSQIHDDSEVYGAGDHGKLVVSQWWAEREGFSE